MLLTIVRPLAAADQIDYVKQIKPLFAEKCYACHGVLKQESELRLETRSLMLKGGASGPVIVPEHAEKSLIVERISTNPDERMPPAGEGTALKPDEIALIKRWIDQGAIAPAEKIPVAPQQHWAFLRIEKPTAADSIDGFLRVKRAEHSLKTQPPAERSILLRRLYLDLIGLPPTRDQLQDSRPWEEIVDELLKSPHHGERWGRHWMDVWRYSDWYGLGAQLRYSQKHLWHWRDWIVESLNADKGYDRMIREMLAGDELAPNDPEVIRATGFLARNYYLFNRTTWLDSTIEHTSKAFLGLTLNCAKCHDHKYDPVTQKDYYRFRAIFEPHQVRLDPLPGVVDLEKDGLPRVFDDDLEIKTYLHRKGNPQDPDKDTEIKPGVPAILSSFAPNIEPVPLPVEAYAPGVRDYVEEDYLKAAIANIEAAKQEVAAAKKQLAKAVAEKPEPKPSPEKTGAFQIRDDFSQPNPEVWELVGKGWEYKDGKLLQTEATRDVNMLRLKQPHPRDFELVCNYTTTGGTTYKSVTFRFDLTDDNQYANFVYTSAYDKGPKVQVAYTRNGKQTYPPGAQVAKPIKVGETYELKFAVRDRLVNAWLNGEFLFAYQLPDRKPGGRLALSGFDATVAFDAVSIRGLPEDVELTEAKTAGPGKPANPEAKLKLAEAKLKAMEAKLASLRASFAADNAKYRDKADAEALDPFVKKAAECEALALKAEAEYEIVAAAADAGKRKAAEAKLKQANQKLEAIKKGEGKYTSLRAAKKALETPAHKETDYPVVYPETSTGRRLALAKWMVSRENPLVARVAVNHVWMRHFGEPLVESVFDFGLRADRPEHAELLDFLAAEFIESGWSFRHLHRLIVTSEAYRLSSRAAGADAPTLAADPNNHFYWRMNARRMEAQAVRDSLLTLAGRLDRKLGGPSLEPGQGNRRSLYFKHSRDQEDKFLSMFDDADHLQCYRRSESIVPQQALALSNSGLAIQMSAAIAAEIVKQNAPPDRKTFINLAFETLLARSPDDAERAECLDFCTRLDDLLKQQKAPEREARIRARLVHALLNHNDFISIR